MILFIGIVHLFSTLFEEKFEKLWHIVPNSKLINVKRLYICYYDNYLTMKEISIFAK